MYPRRGEVVALRPPRGCSPRTGIGLGDFGYRLLLAERRLDSCWLEARVTVSSLRMMAEMSAGRLLHDAWHQDRQTRLAPSGALDSAAHADTVHRTDTTELVRDQLARLETMFTIAGGSLQLVVALGLLNVGLATVDHRSRERAVRRAVGARRREIAVLVLGSAVALSIPVIALAIAATLIASQYVLPAALGGSSLLQAPPFPRGAIGVATIAAMSTSVVGAFAPAIRATRVPIADALRA